MVLAGEGAVTVRLGGDERVILVDGVPRSYPVVEDADGSQAVLEVDVSPGVEVYSFTFG